MMDVISSPKRRKYYAMKKGNEQLLLLRSMDVSMLYGAVNLNYPLCDFIIKITSSVECLLW